MPSTTKNGTRASPPGPGPGQSRTINAQTAATVATTAMAVSTTKSDRRSAVTISLSPCPGREPSPVRRKSVHPADDGGSIYGTEVGPGEGRGGGGSVRTVLA